MTRPQFWLLPAMLLLGTLLHYGDTLPLLSTAAAQSPVSLTTRQSLERILFLVPVLYGTVVFKTLGGVFALAATASILLPKAVAEYGVIDHALPETAGIMVVGTLLILAITGLRGQIELQQKMHESLNFYTAQVLTAQENERKRIARELHDGPAQFLLLICQHLDRLATCSPPETAGKAVEEFDELRRIATQTLTEVRRLAQDLRPRVLDDLGLLAALEWLTDTLSCRYGFRASLEVAGTPPPLSPIAEMLLFRIAQEALQNAGRHSGGTEARVILHGDRDGITLTVTDNGKGLEIVGPLGDLAVDGKLGILGMYERTQLLNGVLSLHAAPGRGTQVVVKLPASQCQPLISTGNGPSTSSE